MIQEAQNLILLCGVERFRAIFRGVGELGAVGTWHSTELTMSWTRSCEGEPLTYAGCFEEALKDEKDVGVRSSG